MLFDCRAELVGVGRAGPLPRNGSINAYEIGGRAGVRRIAGRIALRKLRGRPVHLVFWTARSSVARLQREQLGAQRSKPGPQGPVLLAISDGDEPGEAEQTFKSSGLTEGFVDDPTREIARLYNINCWPTTIEVAPDGVVTRIQYGLAVESPGPQSPKVSV